VIDVQHFAISERRLAIAYFSNYKNPGKNKQLATKIVGIGRHYLELLNNNYNVQYKIQRL